MVEAGAAVANTSNPLYAPDGVLTVFQIEIILWISNGKNNSEIAELMSTSVESVKHQVKRIMDVTGAPTRAAVVAKALRKGVIK